MSSKPSRRRKGIKMMPKPNLQKKTFLTLEDKIAIIKDYHKIGCQKGVLAALHNCYEAQISDVIKYRKTYLNQFAQRKEDVKVKPTNPKPSRFTLRRVIGAVVYEWTKRTRLSGLSVTHDKIREVALEVSKLFNYGNFWANDKWLKALITKYKLTDLGPLKSKIPAEKISRERCDLKKILMDFKTNGPPKRAQIKRSLLKNIDFSNIKLAQNKNVRTESDNNSDSEVSDGYVTNSTESTDFITSMLIDDDNTEELKVKQSTAKTIISSYKEALEYLKPLENFSVMQEDVRAIKRICKLESLLTEEMMVTSV